MSASRDEKTGKWTVQCYYENWKGEKKHKKKRGFATNAPNIISMFAEVLFRNSLSHSNASFFVANPRFFLCFFSPFQFYGYNQTNQTA